MKVTISRRTPFSDGPGAVRKYRPAFVVETNCYGNVKRFELEGFVRTTVVMLMTKPAEPAIGTACGVIRETLEVSQLAATRIVAAIMEDHAEHVDLHRSGRATRLDPDRHLHALYADLHVVRPKVVTKINSLGWAYPKVPHPGTYIARIKHVSTSPQGLHIDLCVDVPSVP